MKYCHHLIFSLVFCLAAVQFPHPLLGSVHEHVITGKTMGTFYSVKFISLEKQSEPLWQEKVEMCLKGINKKLSMFDPKSELSMFNRQESAKEMKISADFHALLSTAQKIYQLTDGAWDGTVKPLVDLWGFGIQPSANTLPDPEAIGLALSCVGFHHIQILPSHSLRKNTPLTLDLGSIAKGYGVDAVAELFISAGVTDVLVEIGGELFASGKNKKKHPWSVGISTPDKETAHQGLYKILYLSNRGIATSGNYRNFFEKNGKTYSHIIDPRTGYPVENQVVSASVIADTCTFADGLATALMVMDIDKSLSLVNSLENTECLIIEKSGQALVSHTSENFARFAAK